MLDEKIPGQIKRCRRTPRRRRSRGPADRRRIVIGKWTAAESLTASTSSQLIPTAFQKLALESTRRIVRPDQNPTVHDRETRGALRSGPRVAGVPLQAVAEDDYGISALKLVVIVSATGALEGGGPR